MNIQQKMIVDIVRRLAAVKAQFKIVLPDGTEYGELEVAKPAKTRQYTAGYGAYKAAYYPLIKDMKPGDMVELDPTPHGFDLIAYRRAISGGLAHLWGPENSMTHINRKTNKVEVLRIE